MNLTPENCVENNKSSLEALSDEELVLLAQGNTGTDIRQSQLAGDIIYHRYKNLVRAKANPYFLLGADKEDLIQEGTWGLVNAINCYSSTGGAHFAEFARICVSTAILSAIKRATSKKNAPLNSYISLYTTIGDENSDTCLADIIEDKETNSPEEHVIFEEQSRKLFSDIKKLLSPLEMDVLQLFLDGMSYKEISDKIGRSTKCVDNALGRIREKIGNKYNEK